MNDATKMTQTVSEMKGGAKLTAALASSTYGTPEPRIEVRFPKDTPYRAQSAMLHALAASVELATPPAERWCVEIQKGEDTGRVYLELSDGAASEAERGMALLRRVVA